MDLDFGVYVNLLPKLTDKIEKVDSHTYRIRCPKCGDSKKDKTKKRFYLLKEKRRYPAVVVCHNCDLRTTARIFFKEFLPEDMEKYERGWNNRDISEIKHITSQGNPEYDIIEELTEEKRENLFQEELKNAKEKVGNFLKLCTYPVIENPEALYYLKIRQIPENYINEMYVLKPEFYDHKKFRYSYFRDYVIIPFVDGTDNKPYYFHSRKFRNLNSDKMSRYLMCPYRTDDPDIKFYMNEIRVNRNETVVIVEGTLDSLHINNSVAVNGIKKITPELIKFFEYRYGGQENIIYALDNELIDVDSKIKVKELLRRGKRVFLWSLLAKDSQSVSKIKDFNDLCVKAGRNNIPKSTIERYSVNNILHFLKEN